MFSAHTLFLHTLAVGITHINFNNITHKKFFTKPTFTFFHKYIKRTCLPTVCFQLCWHIPKYPCSQDTNDEKTKETVKATNKKSPGSKPPPKQPKEKIVKPKKDVVKPGKPVKPDPTAKAKVVGHQPGVVRGITYYKAAKTDEDEHRGGESFSAWQGTLYTLSQNSGVFIESLLSELKQTLC